MLKPLIRTIPNLSGNVKLSCVLSDYTKTDNGYECYVRYAKLLPISNMLAQKQHEVNLLSSAYEFDLKGFYEKYSNTFYETAFSYNKDLYNDADITNELYNRDKDFEFGLKRISAVKNNGSQFAFFAPIWIDDKDDLPDYFLMHIKLDAKSSSAEKTIKIHINETEKKYKHNYLSVYLNKYAKNLNTNVIFCSTANNQATIFGIDLTRGGFVKKIDNIIGKNYKFQSTINKFDLNITECFKRNKMCIKQVMPLSFYFSLEDILTDHELKRFSGAKIKIDGEYWKNGKKIKFYDFSTDYTYFTQDSWKYDKSNFSLKATDKNIMDLPFPSLKEASYYGYEHFNKIKKEAVRWKLKYSSDDYPYITNLSPAFSLAQDSSFKYREFPSTFSRISIYDDSKNNIVSPFYRNLNNSAKSFYNNDIRLINRYRDIMQNNVSTWFNVVDYTEKYEMHIVNNSYDLLERDWYSPISYDEVRQRIKVKMTSDIAYLNSDMFNDIVPENELTENIYEKCSKDFIEEASYYLDNNEPMSYVLYEKQTIFDNDKNWSNVIDNKVYFKGILYDLSEIWKKYPDTQKINKFGVFVHPNFNKISSSMLSQIKSAKWTILNATSYVKSPNAVPSSHLRELFKGEDIKPSLYINEANIGKKTSEVSHDSLFFAAEEGTDGNFIDLTGLGFNVWDLNKYYEVNEVERKFPELTNILEQNRERYIIPGYDQLPIYRLSQILSGHDSLWFEKNKFDKTRWIITSMYFNLRTNHNKIKYDKEIMSKLISKSASYMLEAPLFVKRDFISSYDLSYLTSKDIDSNVSYSAYHYMFNPISVDQNEIYAVNTFSKTQRLDINYGDNLPEEYAKDDIDFMYIDPYNMKDIMEKRNYSFIDSWLKERKYSRTFYARYLNKMHLRTYLTDSCAEYDLKKDKLSRIESIFVKRRILFNDYQNNQVYLKDLYIPIVDFYKNDFCDFYKELCVLIDESIKLHEDYDAEDLSDGSSSFSSYDGEKIYINENFASIHTINDAFNLLTINAAVIRPAECKLVYDNMLRRFLQDIEFDKDTNTWHFSKQFCNTHNMHSLLLYTDDDPIQEEYTFELTFKKNFLRMNEEIWKTLAIDDSSSFTDLYVYRISKEDDYPESLKYNCTNDLTLLDKTTETYNMLQPLFDDVFMQNRISTVIYSEYNQSKISRTICGNDKFYRYDSDNIPVMYDISLYNTKTAPIVSPYGTYYTNSYIENYALNNRGEVIEDINILPTYVKIDNCNSSIELAYGTEQVLQYYSRLSYNYLDKQSETSTTYYSEYEYTRIDFDKLQELNIKYQNPSNIVEEYDDLDNPIVTYTYTSTSYFDSLLRYYDIHARYIPNKIEYDDLNLYDEFKISTYITTYSYSSYYSYSEPITVDILNSDGITSYKSTIYKNRSGFVTSIGYCTYGMIFIDANFDNTNTSFNLLDYYHNDKKYFENVNGRNIYNDSFSFENDFIEFVPFMKFDLFNTISHDTKYIMKPYRFTINTYSYPVKMTNSKWYDIQTGRKPVSNIMLERYFDSITPLITPLNSFSLYNSYMLKLEDKEFHNRAIDADDGSILYKENINIYNNNGARVYKSENEFENMIQVESKHFNDNTSINLERKISIFIGDNLTYDEVLEAEEESKIFGYFADHMRTFGSFDDNEILFLYNKYTVKYDSYPNGIDYNRIEKVYSLTIIFSLL